jgi:outer membrane protein OmpA-like peptidoglycan-associated protein
MTDTDTPNDQEGRVAALVAAANRLGSTSDPAIDRRPARRTGLIIGAIGGAALLALGARVVLGGGGNDAASSEAAQQTIALATVPTSALNTTRSTAPATTERVASAGPVASAPATTEARDTATTRSTATSTTAARAPSTTVDAVATTVSAAAVQTTTAAPATSEVAAPTTSGDAAANPVTEDAAGAGGTAGAAATTGDNDGANELGGESAAPTGPVIITSTTDTSFLPANYSVYSGGVLYLIGNVYSREMIDRIESVALSVLPPERVVNRLELDADAPPPSGLIELQDGLLFPSGSTVVRLDSVDVLDVMATVLTIYPSSRARMSCHTDSVGSFASNLSLSQGRVDAVLGYFLDRGIARERFDVSAKGESEPIGDNLTREGRDRNRRCDIEFVGLI